MADHTLIVGFGNLDRGDDGVAYYVVNAVRRRLVHTPLAEDATGLESLGARVDSVFLVQLVPELLDVLAGYDRVIFVDAHVYEGGDDLRCAVEVTRKFAAICPDDPVRYDFALTRLGINNDAPPDEILKFFDAGRYRRP